MTRAAMPEWLEPMAATLTQERFGAGGDWLFERKFDGIRLLVYKRGDQVGLYSRNRLPQHFPSLARAVAALPHDLILDGEMTWDGQSGYDVFDILWMNGRLLTALPLEERRAVLNSLPHRTPMRRVELLDDADPWDRARREHWEGVIAKRRGSPYEHRRSKHWLKMKVECSQEFVVGGFTDPQGARVGLGALLIGYYDPRQGSGRAEHEAKHDGADLVFAGKLGTGFDTTLLLDLRRRLDALTIDHSPFTRAVGLPRLRAHWVTPKIVVQVSFLEWTDNDKLRHPRLIGVRFDKNPRDVIREQP
jgi:bifunctional non-homologous end joining protein LigD